MITYEALHFQLECVSLENVIAMIECTKRSDSNNVCKLLFILNSRGWVTTLIFMFLPCLHFMREYWITRSQFLYLENAI